MSDLTDADLEAMEKRWQEIHLVFDGPPEHVAGRFVEAENSAGESISVGRWEQRGEYWHLIIPRAAEVERLEAGVAVAWDALNVAHIVGPSQAIKRARTALHDILVSNLDAQSVVDDSAALAELDAGEGPC